MLDTISAKLNAYGFKYIKVELECNTKNERIAQWVASLKMEMKRQNEKLFQEIKNKPSSIVYEHAYFDGSVDTEYTFTIPVEDIDMIEHITRVFYDICAHQLASRMGIRTSSNNAIPKGAADDLFSTLIYNSGIHISLLEEGNYARYEERHVLDPDGLKRVEKFVRNAYMLLYYISTPYSFTRQTTYRRAFVGNDIYTRHNFSPADDQKQSMIYTHGKSMFEFRIFDPVFQKEEYIRNYMSIILKVMDIYKNNVKEKDIVISEQSDGNYIRNVTNFFSQSTFNELSNITMDKEMMNILMTQIDKFSNTKQAKKVKQVAAIVDNDLINKSKVFEYLFKGSGKLNKELDKLKSNV